VSHAEIREALRSLARREPKGRFSAR
jgi:hypothetical protein